MHRRSTITPRDLECMLRNETAEPKPLPLSLLEEITNGFSAEQEIGSGGFAVVYKGKLVSTTVAVKRLTNTLMDEKEFHQEVECLMMVKHKNIVRFLGYCANRQGSMERRHEKFIMADVHQRLLCFEYLPNGNLYEYISDTSHRPKWTDHFQIITGICQGLHHLHQHNIVHLDLKPANILLDANLVPKIADFGLSRCFKEMQSRVFTGKGGTIGYTAPEFFDSTEIRYRHSYRLDIYSLGVIIIEILTGKKGYHDVDKVVESWSKMLDISQSDVQVEQVRVCAEIGLKCTDFNPANRPDTKHIISRLDEREIVDICIKTSMITSQKVKNASNELHKDTPNASGETSSERLNPGMLKNDIMHAIWLSYKQLNPDIKRCVKYCNIFPKRSKLNKDELVHLWITQGFIKTSCVTEDMEDVAEGYVQELVSCSFLQPEEDDYSIKYITILDLLHDLLDKIVGRDYFRIENARSQRGIVWKGDVPRDVRHLFVQNYDGELITKKILALENLRTLIIYVVEKDTPVEEKVIESICNSLPQLRVLAVSFSREHLPITRPNKFSIPESISQLKHLCYLAFRTFKCTVILPSALTELHHIQLLDFGHHSQTS
uniref:Protein kinase domain-containing protein n=6 Tax=Aegilops tauschii subsp. strangulata TaxID=200361 RepID=A0A452XI94_AEGTS